MRLDRDGPSGYEAFDHTADVGLKVRGRSMEDLFEQAAAGFIDLMFETDSVRTVQSMDVSAEGDEPEDLLVAWLQEILFAFEAGQFVTASAEVESLTEGKVTGRLRGEDFDAGRHEVCLVVKAVTYHGLEIERVGEGSQVSIVFDV